VKFVVRDYPLPFHANARPAADAANCANAQGKFWEYHDKLFASQDLSQDKLKAIAGELKLDQKKFVTLSRSCSLPHPERRNTVPTVRRARAGDSQRSACPTRTDSSTAQTTARVRGFMAPPVG
jgi:hypothetical protein